MQNRRSARKERRGRKRLLIPAARAGSVAKSGSDRLGLVAIKPSCPYGNLSGGAAAAANQIDDDHYQSYRQQQVNQASGYMQAEAQQPQNQKHVDNRPKHRNLLATYS